MNFSNKKTVILKNLADDVTEEMIVTIAKKFGNFVKIYFNEEKRFAYVDFETFEDCCNFLNHKSTEDL